MQKAGRFAVLLVALTAFGASLASAVDEAAPSASKKKPSPLDAIFQSDQTQGKAKVETVADTIEYSRDQQKLVARGNVVLTYQDVQVTSDYAELQVETKKAYARGHVIIFRAGEETAKGEEVYYDFQNDTGSFPKGKSVQNPWFTTGEEIQQVKKGVKLIQRASVTTCDLENPHYDIRAKKVTLYEGDKLVAWNVTFYILGKPFFWLPYLIIPLQMESLPFAVTGGINDKFGGYILTSKGFSLTKRIHGKLHADWRSKRGFGGGVDLNYDFGKVGQGSLKTYWTQDDEAPDTVEGFDELEKRDRGRIQYRHRTDLNNHSHVLLQYNRIADEFFLQDFFEREFRSEVEPQSFVTYTANSDHHGFFAHVQKKTNAFESLVEKQPQLRFNWKNQPFFSRHLYYENQISYDQLSKKFGRASRDEDVSRIDNFHEWTAPVKWKNAKLTPFGNFRGTYYSRERFSDNNRYRTVFGYGADLRTHFYQKWNAAFEGLGMEVNQLRHVLEPSIRWNVKHSTVSDETISEFDSVDRIDDSQVITFGLENRLQTKRVVNGRMQRVDLVSFNTFLSYELYPDGRSLAGQFAPFDDGRTSSNFSILSQELVLRPYEWLQYEVRHDFDIEQGHFRVLNQDLLAQTRKFFVLFGHRFIRDIGDIEGSNQFVFEGKWTINSLWGVGGYIRWDTERNRLEEWQIGATRDLHDFILDFGYNVRDSDIRSSNQELYFRLRMKAFPEVVLRGGQQASFSHPRVGETVAGANLARSNVYQQFESY